jgi:hypothetical protein
MRCKKDIKAGKAMGNFGSILVAVLLTLKLTGYCEIAWMWVFAPWWIPLIFIALVIGICGVIGATLKVLED